MALKYVLKEIDFPAGQREVVSTQSFDLDDAGLVAWVQAIKVKVQDERKFCEFGKENVS
tara:strand:+ start:2738 stop:2914 length:177 start_codon:yes stop_codon:yes gene_type:complete